MVNSLEYYSRIKNPDMYLANPDQKFLCSLNSNDRKLTLRFNDLSEISFSIHKNEISDSNFSLIQNKRLIYIDKIGWFQITFTEERIENSTVVKEVIAKSHQIVFSNKGFVTEDRLYMFYNPEDDTDSRYNYSDKSAIPSIVGQLYQQLGIKIDLNSPYREDYDYKEWTITEIDDSLIFKAKSYGEMYVAKEGEENICRTFTENKELYGYDFMVNNVSSAFEVIFNFNFLNHTIQVKRLEDITLPTDIYLSFDNIINSLNIKENTDNITTVLSVNGKDIDIRTVNPMGTNYIVNFDYYKKAKSDDGKINYPWMSKQLIEGLTEWEENYHKWQQHDDERENIQESYSELVKRLQEYYINKADLDEKITDANLRLKYVQDGRDQYILNNNSDGNIIVEEVKANADTLEESSVYYGEDNKFNDNKVITVYENPPTANVNGIYTFGEVGESNTPKNIIKEWFDEKEQVVGFSPKLYFIDSTNQKSYCKLTISSKIVAVKDSENELSHNGTATIDDIIFTVNSNVNNIIVEVDGNSINLDSKNYFVFDNRRYKVEKLTDTTLIYSFYLEGFERYTTPKNTAGNDGWCTIIENHINNLKSLSNDFSNTINEISDKMAYINTLCDVKKYIANKSVELYDELSNYWIEGDFTNDNISVQDNTTLAQRIDLAKQLMDSGEVELEKCSQPQIELSVDAINFTRLNEFRVFTKQLKLGKTISIEKEENVIYRPALMTINCNLDNGEDFSLEFSNASNLTDTAMTIADLIKGATSTSRTVSANWSNLTDYSRNKGELSKLVYEPLNRTLRAAMTNASMQEIIIDDSGILGRRKNIEDENSFSSEQVRLINNTLIFTDDNWESAKTALGKINYGNNWAYGLSAEVLIGNLLLGEKLNIINDDSTITLDGEGITILDTTANDDVVFKATKNGELYVKNYAQIADLSFSKEIEDGKIVSTLSAGENGVLRLDAGQLVVTSGNFQLDENGNVNVSGVISAEEGTIAGLSIALGAISSVNEDNSTKLSITEQGIITAERIEAKENLLANKIETKTIQDKNNNCNITFGTPNSTTTSRTIYLVDGGINSSYRGVVTARLGGSNGIVTSLVSSHTFSMKGEFESMNGRSYSRTYSFTIGSGQSQVSYYLEPRDAGDNLLQYYFITSTSFTETYSQSSNTPAINCKGNLLPLNNDVYKLGDETHLWDIVYASTGSINTSDRNKKNSIEELSDNYSQLFDSLNPVTFKLNSGSSGRKHIGFIAQEVENAIEESGLTTEDFAGFCAWENEDGEKNYGLRYSEFIALCVKEIQKLKEEVRKLKGEKGNEIS